MADKLRKWIVVDFDCNNGCNNPEFNPGCDETPIRIKIDAELSEKYSLFQKYMEIPCPRCGKVGEQKRCGWWEASDNEKLMSYDKSIFYPRDVQDYTKEMMVAKGTELEAEITRIDEQKANLGGMIQEIEAHLKTQKGKRA